MLDLFPGTTRGSGWMAWFSNGLAKSRVKICHNGPSKGLEEEQRLFVSRILKKPVRSHASFIESASVAIDSLRSSKMRSFLTLLGIILSTTTLIAVMAVIHGMDV